jgi:hypothetical protein
MDTQAKVSATSGSPVADPTQFMSLTGALQYLTFTRSDISYVVQQIYLRMHDAREPHLTAMNVSCTICEAPWTSASTCDALPPPLS